MIEKEKPALQTEEKISKTPLSDEEISSLIKASNNSKFNEVELKVKKNERESFKKITLHDIAKQLNKQNKEKNFNEDTKNNANQPEQNDEKKESINKKKDDIKNEQLTENKDNSEGSDKKINTGLVKEEIEIPEKKTIDEDEHLKILNEEKKVAYQKGKTDTLNDIKEGSDAAIAQLKKVIESISKVEELDLKAFEESIGKKFSELIFDFTGKVIEELPKEFLKKIKELLSQLENIEGNVKIFINERDLKVIESNKNIKSEVNKLNIIPGKDLNHGEIELKVNGITIKKTIS